MSTWSRRVAAPGRKLPPPGPALRAVRRPAEVEGLWHPTPECSRALGAPAGKVRLVSYSLCAACRAFPDATERAEGRMLAGAAAALARPESN
jgi:hypothetical protein